MTTKHTRYEHKITVETLWEQYPKTYPSGVDVCRATAKRIVGAIPRCGYEIEVARRVHNGHEQVMWLQNISNAVYRFRVYTDVCWYQEPIVQSSNRGQAPDVVPDRQA